MPNTDHSLKGSNARESVLAFYHTVVAGQPRPQFSWSFAPDGVIEVKTSARPLAAVLWQAANPEARDFRLEAIGPAYRSSTLESSGNGTYTARVPTPARGWVAYFVELTFPSRGPFPLKFTTAVRVAPETLPFGRPPEMMSAAREAAEISPLTLGRQRPNACCSRSCKQLRRTFCSPSIDLTINFRERRAEFN